MQQKKLTDNEDRKKIAVLTTNALERIEHLKALPPSKTTEMDDLVKQLENLAPPTKTLGHSTVGGSSKSLPRGIFNIII